VSQQVLDLRRSVQIVRRHRILVGIIAALGLLAGGGYAALNPPMFTSTALVYLPMSAPSMATQVVIAESDPVVSAALPNVSPSMSVTKLRGELQIKSLTSYIISVSAKGKTPAEAEATANAVANSYIAYVSPKYSIGHVPARILERATHATGSARLTALLSTALIGALAGALIGVIVSLVISRNDRQLRERDEIANSIGIPVLASVPVGHPSDAAGWTRLLEDYKPGAVHAWQLRIALQQLGMVGPILGRPRYNGDGGSLLNGAGSSVYNSDGDPVYNGDGSSLSLLVLSLSSDPGALALGPQLAVFAASLGIPSSLVLGPQQDANATAMLRAACAVPPSASSKRPSLLRVAVSDEEDVDGHPEAALMIVVAVIDGRSPEMPDTLQTTATVLGVSAGVATAEQVARAAVVAAADGREISGIIVADPEPTDRTTGRIPQVRPTRRRLPTHLRGIVTEIRR
jgi:capsular polysaccharide biosynthesis protein